MKLSRVIELLGEELKKAGDEEVRVIELPRSEAGVVIDLYYEK